MQDIIQWCQSEEGQEALSKDSLKDSESIAQLEKERQVSYHMLHTPLDAPLQFLIK